MNAALLLSAAILGLLAYFEPCTIATHTLYAVRAFRLAPLQRWRGLAQLFFLRSALLLLIFGVAASAGTLLEVHRYSPGIFALLLLLTASIYLISRKFYLPVPHVESFRLLPGSENFSASTRLGLTLPACTLPLVAIIATGCASLARWDSAVLAALIFSGAFSLPTLWESYFGLGAMQRAFLGHAARTAPYITAGLLTSAALYLGFGAQ